MTFKIILVKCLLALTPDGPVNWYQGELLSQDTYVIVEKGIPTSTWWVDFVDKDVVRYVNQNSCLVLTKENL